MTRTEFQNLQIISDEELAEAEAEALANTDNPKFHSYDYRFDRDSIRPQEEKWYNETCSVWGVIGAGLAVGVIGLAFWAALIAIG